ncbi:hypothetical protein ACVIGB_000634 [Bradyrhizobium sp. USDA 4341]
MFLKSIPSPATDAMSLSDPITQVMQLELKQIESEPAPTRIALLLARRSYSRGSRAYAAGVTGNAVHSRKLSRTIKIKGPIKRSIDLSAPAIETDLAVG